MAVSKAKKPAAKPRAAAKSATAKSAAKGKAPASKSVVKLVDKPVLGLSDFTRALAERHSISRASLKALYDDLFAEVALALKAGRKVRLTGFGIVQVRERPARTGRNPRTGEAIKIKASKRVAVRVAKDFKERVL